MTVLGWCWWWLVVDLQRFLVTVLPGLTLTLDTTHRAANDATLGTDPRYTGVRKVLGV